MMTRQLERYRLPMMPGGATVKRPVWMVNGPVWMVNLPRAQHMPYLAAMVRPAGTLTLPLQMHMHPFAFQTTTTTHRGLPEKLRQVRNVPRALTLFPQYSPNVDIVPWMFPEC
jgi:hypothetical protein